MRYTITVSIFVRRLPFVTVVEICQQFSDTELFRLPENITRIGLDSLTGGPATQMTDL